MMAKAGGVPREGEEDEKEEKGNEEEEEEVLCEEGLQGLYRAEMSRGLRGDNGTYDNIIPSFDIML